jgi:hypothetical protein
MFKVVEAKRGADDEFDFCIEPLCDAIGEALTEIVQNFLLLSSNHCHDFVKLGDARRANLQQL